MPQGRKKFDEREKQAVLERLWLTYYNDTLFSRGADNRGAAEQNADSDKQPSGCER